MNGYVCFYNGKRVEVFAETAYQAQLAAAEKLRVSPKRRSSISVVLAERDGAPVVHAAAD